MADLWLLLERTRVSIMPVLVFLLTLYLPRLQRIYAQSPLDIEMGGINTYDNCVEGQTVILYCEITGISAVSQYEVNWTKGVRKSQSTGVTLVNLDRSRVTYSTWKHGDDSITYTLRLDNTTVNDSGVYTCQVFFRYLMAWSSTSGAKNVNILPSTKPLPRCKNMIPRNNYVFYAGEQVQFSCQSRVDESVTLGWMRHNVDRTQALLPEMDITHSGIETHFLIFTAVDELNGAIYVCTQFDKDTGKTGGNCMLGPVHILPPPTVIPTTTITPKPTTLPTTTTTKPSTLVPTLPVLHGYGGMAKYNETDPEVRETATKVCPQYGYIVVPIIIAVVSVVINFYLIAKLRNARQSKVDKMCENRHCGTRYRSGTLDKDEYCSCGYMLKIAQHESEV